MSPKSDADVQMELAGVLRSKQILIADGHHRYETLLALAPELRPLDSAAGQAASDFGLMYLAPAEDPGLLVLATHRLVRGIADFDLAALRASASPAFDIVEGNEDTPAAIEERLAREGVDRVTFAVRVPGNAATIILAPLLAIDEEAMANQSYLGYTHDTAEAMARVASGEYQAAFLMNPTKIDQVLAACEAGFTLPQKSTYFQPKLATGLLMYRLDGPAPQPPR
jgi:uncharacterized protein (DUF1015 family)